MEIYNGKWTGQPPDVRAVAFEFPKSFAMHSNHIPNGIPVDICPEPIIFVTKWSLSVINSVIIEIYNGKWSQNITENGFPNDFFLFSGLDGINLTSYQFWRSNSNVNQRTLGLFHLRLQNYFSCTKNVTLSFLSHPSVSFVFHKFPNSLLSKCYNCYCG